MMEKEEEEGGKKMNEIEIFMFGFISFGNG